MRRPPRNVILFALCQAVMNSATSLMVTASALVGLALASSKALATLPLSLMFLSMMLTSIPASMLMSRWGRKPGFIFSSLIGMLAAAIATWAIMVQSFWLFCTASAGVGIFNGFGNYYRFAAVDSAAEAHKSKAISWVLAGGVAAAFIGPNLANYSQNLIEHARFAGSFAALFILYLLAFIVLQYIEPPP
ncbi:MAG TPA: MFS transporter, partial [Gammaproteobacteria bacterium]|nr:MFS transporter [Gammaproteobacteria bacterium]